MGIYDNQTPIRTVNRKSDLEAIILDNHRPSMTVTRMRKEAGDGFREADLPVAGPFTVRIEPFRSTRSTEEFDEKGTSSNSAYILVAVGLPKYQDTAKTNPTFKLEDTLLDQYGNKYKVTSPARYELDTVEINIELIGV